MENGTAGIFILNSSTACAKAYVARRAECDEAGMAECFDAIKEWAAAEFEKDGYSAAQIDGMDLDSLAQTLIQRAAGA